MPDSAAPRLWTVGDVVGLGNMTLAWSVVRLLPERQIPGLARLVVGVTATTAGSRVRRGASEMQRALDLGDDTAAARLLFLDHCRRQYEQLFGKVLDTQRRAWHPETEVTGLEHLRGALSAGRGAILWGMSFCGSVVPKMALARAGFRLTHLSRPGHGGFGDSLVARRLLNPWHLRAENKYLAERVVRRGDGAVTHVRVLQARLRANKCVSISGESVDARSVAATVLGQQRRFASGAPWLARSTGAVLLTLGAHRRQAGRYTVEIDPPVVVDAARRPADVAHDAVREFARRLERRVREHPADWERWTARRE